MAENRGFDWANSLSQNLNISITEAPKVLFNGWRKSKTKNGEYIIFFFLMLLYKTNLKKIADELLNPIFLILVYCQYMIFEIDRGSNI